MQSHNVSLRNLKTQRKFCNFSEDPLLLVLRIKRKVSRIWSTLDYFFYLIIKRLSSFYIEVSNQKKYVAFHKSFEKRVQNWDNPKKFISFGEILLNTYVMSLMNFLERTKLKSGRTDTFFQWL